MFPGEVIAVQGKIGSNAGAPTLVMEVRLPLSGKRTVYNFQNTIMGGP